MEEKENKKDELKNNELERKKNVVNDALEESVDYLRIGKSEEQEVFVLSIGLKKSKYLQDYLKESIAKSGKRLPHGSGYWFSYTIFNILVQTDIFYDVDDSLKTFSPIHDNFRLMSCLEDLRKELNVLTIYFCTTNVVLGTIEVSFHDILEQEKLRNVCVYKEYKFKNFFDLPSCLVVSLQIATTSNEVHMMDPINQDRDSVDAGSRGNGSRDKESQEGIVVSGDESSRMMIYPMNKTNENVLIENMTQEENLEKSRDLLEERKSQLEFQVQNLEEKEMEFNQKQAIYTTEYESFLRKQAMHQEETEDLKEKWENSIQQVEEREKQLEEREKQLEEREGQLEKVEILAQASELKTEEWEIWRRKEEKAWLKQMEEKEKERMDELEHEWSLREEERQKLMKTTQTEYSKLQMKLRKSLANVEARERKIAVAEADMERKANQKMEDLQSMERRYRAESSHAITMSKKSTQAAETRVKLLETSLQKTENRLKQVEEDYDQYRHQQRRTPEATLREEIARMRGIHAEMEKRFEEEKRINENYRKEVEKLNHQLEKLAQLLHAEKKKNETRIYEDLEQLRLQYLAREERYVLDGERQQLNNIKKELDMLREATLVHASEDSRLWMQKNKPSCHPKEVNIHSPTTICSPTTTTTNDSQTKSSDSSYWKNNKEMEKESMNNLQRLKKEKEDLLRSAAYNEDSALIQEINRYIHMTEANCLVK